MDVGAGKRCVSWRRCLKPAAGQRGEGLARPLAGVCPACPGHSLNRMEGKNCATVMIKGTLNNVKGSAGALSNALKSVQDSKGMDFRFKILGTPQGVEGTMMTVSDTSPIVNLAVIGQIELLQKFFLKIFIPHSRDSFSHLFPVDRIP